MSRGVNKVIIVGTLGKDPDIKYTPGGACVANISVATNEEWKDKKTGETVKDTEWHRIVFWNKLAEVVAQYLTKGSQVYVEGKIKTRKWQDQSGQDRYTTEILARELQMLGGGSGKNNNSAPSNNQQQQPQQQSAADFNVPSDDDGFDDIPF